jgi:hypothetical protein
MKHKTSRLVPNTLAQTLVVLKGSSMNFLEYVCKIQVAVENVFYINKFQPLKQVNHPKDAQ